MPLRVLFVSNGHGEAAIADRIAAELPGLRSDVSADHLALVGDAGAASMRDVGPRRAMPSGGLIAMGQLDNLVRDVRGGLIGLTFEQWRFLRRARGAYAAAIAVGDVFALLMTRLCAAPVVFVGTAKSVSVAPYGRLEEHALRRARARFVRDEPTAQRLRAHGVDVEPAANVIVDLFAAPDDPRAAGAARGFEPCVVLLPGSRESAYADAQFLLDVSAALAATRPRLGAVLSLAAGLDAARVIERARAGGWDVVSRTDPIVPFELAKNGRTIARAWRGTLGPVLSRAVLALGQAGTANEAAAAGGVPVVAFDRDRTRKTAWYRRRQQGLLGDALAIVAADVERGAAQVAELLEDAPRRQRMGEIGRTRMGVAGGARRIAQRIVALVEER